MQSVLNEVDTKQVWSLGEGKRAMNRRDLLDKLFIFREYLFKFTPTDTLLLIQASKMTYTVRNKTFLMTDFFVLNAFQ